MPHTYEAQKCSVGGRGTGSATHIESGMVTVRVVGELSPPSKQQSSVAWLRDQK